jgi:2-phospho-L-lactate guanylyltransferase
VQPVPHLDAPVVLLVPIKPLAVAKSRLRASQKGGRTPAAHRALVLAMALDTIAAAKTTRGVAKVVVVTSDDQVIREVSRLDVETIAEAGQMGLNEALDMGARVLRSSQPAIQIGALNADLPALQPAELSAALRQAAGHRAFSRDRHGTGTTLLLGAVGEDLAPRFGHWSASAHAASGATELTGRWPSLRCDVDTESDLSAAAELQLGAWTRSVLASAPSLQPGRNDPGAWERRAPALHA